MSGALEEAKMVDSVKKRARKARTSMRAEAADEATATIVLLDVNDAPQYYANHIEVSHNHHEFEMFFARVPTKVDFEQIQNIKQSQRIEVETSVRVIIPPSLMADLIRVLKLQNEKHQEAVKIIGDKEAGSEQ